MKTHELCHKPVVTAIPAASLNELARLMRANHVGSVVVLEERGRKPVGIVTDRDIVVEVLAMGLDPSIVTAGDIMTRSPAVASGEEDALWALKVMRDRGVRRLPVVDSRGELEGIIAFDDLVQHLGTTLADIAQLIGTERVVEGARRN
jgi:CBS domain-containing protein